MGTVSDSHQPGNAALLDAALRYHARGWCIIPIAPGTKKAAVRWEAYQQERPGEGLLRRWFSSGARFGGLAVVLGRVSGGLAVRDFDDASAYHAWARAHPRDAAALGTVETSRGHHVYGRLDRDQYLTLPDGELRADPGHYVLAPPSLHPEGGAYRWTIPLPEGELPALPASLMQAQPTQAGAADPADPGTPSITIAWWTSAVAGTLPTAPGQRNRQLFELARRLKAVRPDATPAELREIVREWCKLALPRTSGKHGFGDCWADFALAWQRVRRPAGQSFAAAAADADAEGLPAALERLGYDGPLRRLAALCWQLGRQWGHRPFPLGCEIAGRHLGVSTRHAGRLLQALRFDGLITRVSKGTKASGKASEWRFVDPEQRG